MHTSSEDFSAARRECIEFTSECQKVLLATESNGGELEVGYSPFVRLNDEFYLYLSECSIQSENMIDSGQANLMFIEDELSSPNVFARRRLTYRCDVNAVPRGYQYTRIMVAFQERMGSLMDSLRRMPDCQLFRITPGAGRYVNGLAQVFTFRGCRAESFMPTASEPEQQEMPDLRRAG